MEEYTGFPSHFVDPSVKAGAKWCKSYAKAIVQEARLGSGTGGADSIVTQERMRELRQLAQGKQPTDRYKQLLQAKRDIGTGKKNLSFKNLDYSILRIAPKFVEQLVGKLTKEQPEVVVKAVDSLSVSEKRKRKFELVEYIHNKALYESVTKATGISFDEPDTNGLPAPESEDQVETHVDLTFKPKLAMDMQELIALGFSINEIQQLDKEVTRDAIEVGIGGYKTWNDAAGYLRIRKIVPENLRTNPCRFPDFRDLNRVVEFIYVTISELKQMWPNQSEQTYLDIANKASSNRYYTDVSMYQQYYFDNFSYPYDSQKITIADCEWKSVDNIVRVVKNGDTGNPYEKKFNYYNNPNQTEKDFKEKYGSDRRLIRKEIANWYRCKLIVGTDYVFDYGLLTNMIRQSSNLADAKPTYVLYTTNGDSIIARVETVLHNIQLNWLQYQHHVASSRPSGIDIEMSAFENLSLGRGGEKMSPKQALQLYFETGIIVWRRKDWTGAGSQWRPIQELKNGLNPAAGEHFSLIIQGIDLLRNIIGMPQVVDSSVEDPRIGKAVTQMAYSSTMDGVDFLMQARNSLIRRTGENSLILIQDSIKFYGGQQYLEALGKDTIDRMAIIEDMDARELSIEIVQGPDYKQQEFVEQMLLKSVQEGAIDDADALMVKSEKNPYKAVMMLKRSREKIQKQKLVEQEAQFKAKAEADMQSAMATKEADMERMTEEGQIKMQTEAKLSQLRIQEETAKFQLQFILEKYKKGAELEQHEQEMVNKLMNTRLQGEYMLAGKQLDAKNRPKQVAK